MAYWHVFRVCLACVATLLSGCASETLFQSSFNATPSGQPPAVAQQVGTARVTTVPVGSVVVVDGPVAPASTKWVRLTRPNGPDVPIFQGNLSTFRGPGKYVFSTYLYFPSDSSPFLQSLGTVQLEAFNQPLGTWTSFLHLDFLSSNTVRVDDNPAVTFGSFARDQPFILQVSIDTSVPAPVAHIVLAGATANGVKDYTIQPAFRSIAQQFGALRLWLGFPHVGSFDATNIVVTHSTQ